VRRSPFSARLVPQSEPHPTAPKKKGRNARGIFEKVPGSDVWWIRYVDAQSRYRREKAGTWATARDLYIKRKNEALVGKKLPEKLRRGTVMFAGIANDALAYSRGHKRSYRDDKSRMKRLVEWFGNREAEYSPAGKWRSAFRTWRHWMSRRPRHTITTGRS
jgi:hypothetical protein